MLENGTLPFHHPEMSVFLKISCVIDVHLAYPAWELITPLRAGLLMSHTVSAGVRAAHPR